MDSEAQPQPLKFFVHVIESPSPIDLYKGTSEGVLVQRAVALDGIPCVVRTTVNREAFGAALHVGLTEAMREQPGHLPVVHISAHGNASGIQLTSGEVVTWQQLHDLLDPISKTLNGFLLLCMSACEGYSACQMAMRLDRDGHPYFALVANHGRPTWGDTAIAYAAFYHRLAQGTPIPDSVEAMKSASGNDCWICETAEQSRNAFAEYVKTANLSEASQQLETAIDAARVESHEKFATTSVTVMTSTSGIIDSSVKSERPVQVLARKPTLKPRLK